MAVIVKDKARDALIIRGIAAADDAVGTQRVFLDAAMEWKGDQIDPHVPTMHRLIDPTIVGSFPTSDDTGHIIKVTGGVDPAIPPVVDGLIGNWDASIPDAVVTQGGDGTPVVSLLDLSGLGNHLDKVHFNAPIYNQAERRTEKSTASTTTCAMTSNVDLVGFIDEQYTVLNMIQYTDASGTSSTGHFGTNDRAATGSQGFTNHNGTTGNSIAYSFVDPTETSQDIPLNSWIDTSIVFPAADVLGQTRIIDALNAEDKRRVPDPLIPARLYIGCQDTGSSRSPVDAFFWAQTLLYNRVLTTEELDTLHAWLRDKWPNTGPGPLPVTNGLIGQYEADDAANFTFEDTDRIVQWDDMSGADNHLTQASGSALRPAWADGKLLLDPQAGGTAGTKNLLTPDALWATRCMFFVTDWPTQADDGWGDYSDFIGYNGPNGIRFATQNGAAKHWHTWPNLTQAAVNGTYRAQNEAVDPWPAVEQTCVIEFNDAAATPAMTRFFSADNTTNEWQGNVRAIYLYDRELTTQEADDVRNWIASVHGVTLDP